MGPTEEEVWHYTRAAPEKMSYPLKRYTDETLRLFGVLDTRLKEREYLAGLGKGKYSIADMNAYPWYVLLPLGVWPILSTMNRIKSAGYIGIESLDKFPSLKACYFIYTEK